LSQNGEYGLLTLQKLLMYLYTLCGKNNLQGQKISFNNLGHKNFTAVKPIKANPPFFPLV